MTDRHATGGDSICISGAAGGVGSAVASSLAANDLRTNLILLDRMQADLDRVADAIGRDRPGKILTYSTDVNRAESVDEALNDGVEHTGKIDGLVACAGVRMKNTPIHEVTDPTWLNVFDGNTTGVFNLIRATARQMINGQVPGSIISLSSLLGSRGRLGQSAYCASKAAITHLTRVAALDLAKFQIRANAIAPGTIATPMLELAKAQDGEHTLEKRIYGDADLLRPGIPSRRIASVEDVSSLVRFLLSGHASHITGQVIHLDGGESVL